MATQKSNQPAPDRAVENLLAEIASTAYCTEQRLCETSLENPELREYELDQLRHTIARLGWMADMALKRLGSVNCMHEGDAVAWLLPHSVTTALAQEVQS